LLSDLRFLAPDRRQGRYVQMEFTGPSGHGKARAASQDAANVLYLLIMAMAGILMALDPLAPIGLDSAFGTIDNGGMKTIPGRVRNGVVVLKSGTRLPEGAAVTVMPGKVPIIRVATRQRRVVFPLVPSKKPGSLRLTGERIAEILLEQDVSS